MLILLFLLCMNQRLAYQTFSSNYTGVNNQSFAKFTIRCSSVYFLFLFKLVVSGLHARIRKKDGNLLVTDLDSTNGTFIDDQRLRPGVVATLSPGSCVTFGKMSPTYSCLSILLFFFVIPHK